MTNAIDFNWFYHNNCKEFQGIKRMIWECNNPTEKQLLKWREEHRVRPRTIKHLDREPCVRGRIGRIPIRRGYFKVIRDIEEIKEESDTREWEWMNFAEFAFDMMYQDGNCAPWLKG